MRKWLFFLVIIAAVYMLSQVGRRKESRSSFLKRLNETFSIIAWVLLAVYTLAFLYWLFTEIFG